MPSIRRFDIMAALVVSCVAADALVGGRHGPSLARAATPAGHVTSAANSDRIVSLGSGITETLYALGQAHRIVAVDSTSQHPPEALLEKANVGYVRALSIEGVLSVRPSLILAVDGAGPPEVVKAMTSSSVPFVTFPDVFDAPAIVARIIDIARHVGCVEQGERLAAVVEKRFARLASDRRRIAKPTRTLFILSTQAGRIIVGGLGTSADAALRLAGLANAADQITGFKPLTEEGLLALEPEAIVVMRRGNDPDADAQRTTEILSIRGIETTAAGKSKRIVAMNGSYLLGFGPRAPDAAFDLLRLLHPELGLSHIDD